MHKSFDYLIKCIFADRVKVTIFLYLHKYSKIDKKEYNPYNSMKKNVPKVMADFYFSYTVTRMKESLKSVRENDVSYRFSCAPHPTPHTNSSA